MASLIFILLMLIVAIFSYPLCMDDTQHANRITLELATKPPGYTCLVLTKQISKKEEGKQNIISYLLYGKPLHDIWIPVKGVELLGDSLRYEYLVDEDLVEIKTEVASAFVKTDHVYTSGKTFFLGTDRYGRDVLSRLILGTRVSLAVGIIAVLLSISIGVLLGALAGYFGGWVDEIITWFINVVWSIPTLLLVFTITFLLGKGFWQIFIAVGLTMWVGTARLIRGQVMSLKELEYIQAAKVMGFSHFRIILQHIVPNIIGPTIVLAAGNFATAILIEAGLSFLGIGVQPPVSSWGLMIKENYNFIITNRPLLALIPGFIIMLNVLAFNMLGNGLRDVLDVKEKI